MDELGKREMRTRVGRRDEAHEGGVCQQGIVGSEGDWPGKHEQGDSDEQDNSPSELTEMVDGYKV